MSTWTRMSGTMAAVAGPREHVSDVGHAKSSLADGMGTGSTPTVCSR
jgi:hypothetical protein